MPVNSNEIAEQQINTPPSHEPKQAGPDNGMATKATILGVIFLVILIILKTTRTA